MNDAPFPTSSAAEELLRRWIGLDPHSIGEAAIHRAVRLRMVALAIDDITAYIRLLENESAERDRLVEEVVVAESWFFRDPHVYDHVRRFVASRLAANPSGPPVRILSVPCAAGEEPYSVAMTLLDAGVAPERFQIDAIDVSRVALARALAGRYSPNAFRNADGSYRDRWFRTEGGMAVLDEAVRACVRFSWGNVLEESVLSETLGAGRGSYDVVFCRNLLIYLTPSARASVERAIDRLLKPEGIVVLGAAEPAILRGRWVAYATGSSFTLRRAMPGDSPRWPAPPAATGRTATVQAARRRQPEAAGKGGRAETDPEDAAPEAPREPAPAPSAPAPSGERQPSGPQTDSGAQAESDRSDVAPLPASLSEALSSANSLANARRFTEAVALCEAFLRAHGPSPDLYFMAGMIHQTSGNLDGAEECFHKTLYLDGTHEDALLALSLLAESRGEADQARQYRHSARRIMERKGRP